MPTSPRTVSINNDINHLCPLCGKPNQCAMEVQRCTGIQQPPCWCTQATFSQALLSSIPDAALGKACVCSACAAAATD